MSGTSKMGKHCCRSTVGGLMVQADTINPPCSPPGPSCLPSAAGQKRARGDSELPQLREAATSQILASAGSI